MSIYFCVCVCDQVIAYDHSTTATEKCLWTVIAYDHSTTAYDHFTTAAEKCLWTHPFENRTKLSPFVSRGSTVYRAPQGKIECDNCVTWVSWPSLLGQNRIYTNNVIWVALNLIVYDHSTTATEKCLRTHPFENRTKKSPLFREGPIYIETGRAK